jgi:diadenosine tetraphosphate (Ap4A) HIT family hydrolase
MKDPNNPCIFCKIRKNELQFENQLAYSSIDSYPVSEFHSLIVPKRHVETYFELTKKEIQACNELILKTKEKILKQDSNVKGFNIGTNAGKSAGQSIMHCHIHLIPRREGDVENPQGGVRSVIPNKQHYKRKL